MMSVDTPLPERLDAALRSRLGDGWLLGEDARRRHGEDSSKRWALPAAVALPRDVDDVVAIVRACREHRVPIVARGAGTSSTGAALPYDGGVGVSFERMARVPEIRAADRQAVVQQGLHNGAPQRALEHGRGSGREQACKYGDN